MAFRKIPFSRFKEGDNFSSSTTGDRFETFENSLGSLAPTLIAEGALNYPHLSDSRVGSLSFGSPVLAVHSVRMTSPNGPGTMSYHPEPNPGIHIDTTMSPGWSAFRGQTIGSSSPAGIELISPAYPLQPLLMEVNNIDAKIGSGFAETSPGEYSSGILILFNIPCHRVNRYGLGIEAQFKDQNGDWHPILGSDRWHLYIDNPISSKWDVTPSSGSALSLRIWLPASRVEENTPGKSSAYYQNLKIQDVRIKFGCSQPIKGETVSFGAGYLTVISFRAGLTTSPAEIT